jgi:hypothetical protein
MFDDNSGQDDRVQYRSPWITTVGEDRSPKIDLDAFTTEAQLDGMMAEEARKKGVPKKHFDPNWQPKRKKGDKLDKEAEDYLRAAEAAVRGLPLISCTTWMEVQAFDNGPANGRRAHTQYVLKLTGTAAAAGALMAKDADKRSLSTTRYSFLSTPKIFVRNLRRKKDRHALADFEWTLANSMVEFAADRPDALLGALSCKFYGEGTSRSIGQFACMTWGEDAQPVVMLCQQPRGGEVEAIQIELGHPPKMQPDRKPTACRWYASRYSAEFRKLLDADPQQALRDKMTSWRKSA